MVPNQILPWSLLFRLLSLLLGIGSLRLDLIWTIWNPETAHKRLHPELWQKRAPKTRFFYPFLIFWIFPFLVRKASPIANIVYTELDLRTRPSSEGTKPRFLCWVFRTFPRQRTVSKASARHERPFFHMQHFESTITTTHRALLLQKQTPLR